MTDTTLQMITEYISTQSSDDAIRSSYSRVSSLCSFTGKDFLDLTQKDILAFINRRELNMLSRTTYLRQIREISLFCERFMTRNDEKWTSPIHSLYIPDLKDAESYGTDQIMSDEEMDHMLLAASDNPQLFLIIILSVRLCLQPSQVVTLRCYDFSCHNGKYELKIPAKPPKEDRIVTIPDDVLFWLLPYLADSVDNFLFTNINGDPCSLKRLQRMFNEYGFCRTPKDLRNYGFFKLLQGGATKLQVADYTATTGRWLYRYDEILKNSPDPSNEEYHCIRISADDDRIDPQDPSSYMPIRIRCNSMPMRSGS